MEKLQIFVGWDPREDIAWRVCRYSILSRTNPDLVSVQPLVQRELRQNGLYTRPADLKASTEFSLTRFLTPALAGGDGFAIFMDCDFLLQTDILKVLNEVNPSNAVSVVQHDYTPTPGIKMDGQIQYVYPRKNWSSFIVFNLKHPAVRALTANVVNRSEPAYLHRFEWAPDETIGGLSKSWNYLSGWYSGTPTSHPNAIHYTEGGPWFSTYADCDFATEWKNELAAMQRAQRKEGAQSSVKTA